MSIRRFKNNPRTLALVGLLLGFLMAVPVCFAGGAAAIVQDKHQLAPKGSYIPKRRVEEVLNKIEEHKAMKQRQKALEQEQKQQKTQSPQP